MLGDWRHFSCTGCAAAPNLQTLNGCWVDTPRVVAEYAGHEFRRCPVLYVDVRARELADFATDGSWKALGPLERRRLTPKRFEALRYAADFVMPHAEGASGNGH